MAPPVEAANVDAAISVAADVARDFGLKVEQPVLLRSTNNAVAWLRPADVVAKVSVGRNSRLGRELQVAQRLCALADVERGDMREHAKGHLAHIREEIAPSVR